MKRAIKKAGWVLGGIALLMVPMGLCAWAILGTLGSSDRTAIADYLAAHQGPVVLGLVAIVAAFGFVFGWLFDLYPARAAELAERIGVILRTGHYGRLQEVEGGPEIRRLAEAVDGLVERNRAQQAETQDRVATATASLQEERNRLAALMAELDQAVIACTVEGRILLYNQLARTMFGSRDPAALAPSPVGLGRSVFTVVPREVVLHAMSRLQDAPHETAEADAAGAPAVTVTVNLADGRLLRVRFAAVERAESHYLSGLVLLLDDVSQPVAVSQQRLKLLQNLTEATRSGLAGIRAAVEMLLEYEDMSLGERRKFIRVIADETTKLSGGFEGALSDDAESLRMPWQLEDLRASDLLGVVAKHARDVIGLDLRVGSPDPLLWLTTDSYTLTRAVARLCQAAAEQGRRAFALDVQADGSFAHLDVTWVGLPARAEDVARWEGLCLSSRNEPHELTVRAVLERHGGEFWALPSTDGRPGIRILLRSAVPPRRILALPGRAVESRPEFYDFDLLRLFREPPELEHRGLEALSYTVLDTETTGLDPNHDGIISIGAFRIVNARLLQSETFEQLVDPGRPISRASKATHGISDEEVRGKPLLKDVLPAFHRFCEETVLVGHNVAFDLRFLQRGEEASGVVFDHPVLDTLLLSAVLFPEQGPRTLDELADRFGVAIVGRHTAVGDAMATGHVFVHMLELLRGQGIVTFGDAVRAAQETYLARVKY